MIIICCTDTYFKWGELFLRSFKITNDNNIPIHINGIRLSDVQINKFKSIYPNLTIVNRQYNEKEVAKKYGVTVQDVRRCSEAISRGFKDRCRWWMDFIAVDGRIPWLLETMLENKDSLWWLHMDIDSLFRESIQPIIDKINENDVVCRFRPDRSFRKPKSKEDVHDSMKIAAGMVGLRGNNGIKFIEQWIKGINSKTWKNFNTPNVEGRGGPPWGQTTLYYAYEHFKDVFKWGEIEMKWLLAGCNPANPIWMGHRKGTIVYRGDRRHIPDRTKLRDIFFEELKLMEDGI